MGYVRWFPRGASSGPVTPICRRHMRHRVLEWPRETLDRCKSAPGPIYIYRCGLRPGGKEEKNTAKNDRAFLTQGGVGTRYLVRLRGRGGRYFECVEYATPDSTILDLHDTPHKTQRLTYSPRVRPQTRYILRSDLRVALFFRVLAAAKVNWHAARGHRARLSH